MEILLTADRTLMSTYHDNEFIGFGTTAPPYILPEWLYKALFFPPLPTRDGIPTFAPYGLRKIEAQLINEGFDVLTVDSDSLKRYLDEAKVLAIHVMDPFGLGPSSTTLSRILKTGETYSSKYFRAVLEKPEIKKAQKRGLKIIIGGPGAWQLKYRPKFLEEHQIDCVIEGEAERIIGDLFRRALKGDELPRFYEVGIKEVPSLEEIPDIRRPSINGLIEIGRGCCRGCDFCQVTLRPLRWYPLEKIERELKLNTRTGIRHMIFHAEDVLLYGSKNTIPNREKILELSKLGKKYALYVNWSHASMAATAADTKLMEETAEILIDETQETFGAEIGIETGSGELVKKAMRAKAHPFKPEQWPEVVKTAAGVMTDNNFVPACTLIVGLPQETDDDVVKTIELMDDLKDFKSLIVPLFFVPVGRLKDEDWFRTERLSDLHKELLLACMRHDVRWVYDLLQTNLKGKWYRGFVNPLYRLFIRLVKRKARKAGLVF